jgi:hypothetical protein
MQKAVIDSQPTSVSMITRLQHEVGLASVPRVAGDRDRRRPREIGPWESLEPGPTAT